MRKGEVDLHPRPDRWWASPLAWGCVVWVAGLLIGEQGVGGPVSWLIGAGLSLPTGLFLLWRRNRNSALVVMNVGLVCLAAAWWGLRLGPTGVWGLEAAAESRLVQVEGVIEGSPYVQAQATGLLGPYDYHPPATLLILRVDRVRGRGGWHRASCGVLVDIPEYDGRLCEGDRVRCVGWLSRPISPANPAEPDRGRQMRRQGVVGRLTLKTAGNCELIGTVEGSGRWWAAGRYQLAARMKWALRRGWEAYPLGKGGTMDLLEAMLLGDWRGELSELYGDFKRAGLAHVLAISGMHMGILVIGTWWLAVSLLGRPRPAAGLALAVIGLYLLVVPTGVAILRSGLMAAVACVAMTWGRRTSAMAAMCGAAWVLLAWRPGDLFSAGFQLSFVVVAGLVLLVPRVSQWVYPTPLIPTLGATLAAFKRRAADSLAAHLVGWSVSLPLLAYHFGAVIPVALVFGLVVLPIAAMLLWVGYLKILLTLIQPALGEALAGPMMGLAQAMADLATLSADLPWAMLGVPHPSIAWAATSMAVIGLWLGGLLAGRRWTTAACLGLCAAWLYAPIALECVESRFSAAALRLDMFAVGNGSCYLLRSGGRVMVFDCGSSNHTDITTASIGPALRSLGVARVDSLVLSHPDADHFSGAVELVDGFGVRRVLMTQLFLDELDRHPDSAAAELLRQLQQRPVRIETAAQGRRETFGQARIEFLWPPAGRTFERHNDGSLVLAAAASGRRLLLTGDLQQQAMEHILSSPQLPAWKADVMELPHHGAMVEASPRFVAAIGPRIALQSTGPSRLLNDPWPDQLDGVRRFITHIHGMVELAIGRDGRIETRTYRKTAPHLPTEPFDPRRE